MRFPKPCAFCGALSVDGLCRDCERELSRSRSSLRHSLAFCEDALTLFEYENALVKKGVFALKSRGVAQIARRFSVHLAAAAQTFGREFFCVTFVPRRTFAANKYGVDQARILAHFVAKELGLPCVRLLRRRGFSRRQHDLPARKRIENVRGKFRAVKNVPNGAVLLVDDIITTGATVTECARVLSEAGVKSVCALALMRGGAR